MQAYQHQFIQLALEHNVLTFGEFILKSGRKSPYFFNSGLFFDAQAIKKLGEFYAEAILSHQINADVLFGPAYKGIPLVVSAGIALANKGKNFPLTFNRKEAKDHGEGGCLIGAPLKNKRVLILDDVITAGTAFYESKHLIESSDGTIAGVIVAFNREEKRMDGEQSAIEEIQEKENIPVISLISFTDLIQYLNENSHIVKPSTLKNMIDYQKQYGA